MADYIGTATGADIDKITGLQSTAIQIDDAVNNQVEYATDTEAFDKVAGKALSPQVEANMFRSQKYDVQNLATAINVTLIPGAEYNLLSALAESNESYGANMALVFKDINDVAQATYLDEANDKYLFPSNLYTSNLGYVEYKFRIIIEIDHPSIGSNQTTTLKTSLNRAIDDSEITGIELNISQKPLTTDFKFTVEFTTFVNTETDPFVLDGMYVNFLNEVGSSDNIVLKSVDVDLFKR